MKWYYRCEFLDTGTLKERSANWPNRSVSPKVDWETLSWYGGKDTLENARKERERRRDWPEYYKFRIIKWRIVEEIFEEG